MTMACEASARMMSLSVIPPTALRRMRIGTSVFSSFSSLLGEGFDRPLNVGLDDQVEVLDLLLGHLAVEVFERDGLAVGLSGISGAEPAGLGDFASAGDVVDDGEGLAGRGHDVEAGDLDRGGRPGRVDRPAVVVEQGADPTDSRRRRR